MAVPYVCNTPIAGIAELIIKGGSVRSLPVRPPCSEWSDWILAKHARLNGRLRETCCGAAHAVLRLHGLSASAASKILKVRLVRRLPIRRALDFAFAANGGNAGCYRSTEGLGQMSALGRTCWGGTTHPVNMPLSI